MSAPTAERGPVILDDLDPDAPVLDVVIPVHNEERALTECVDRLHRHLSRLPYSFRITVADNASTDATALVAHRLCQEYAGVRAVFLPEKGRGRALKHVWSTSGSQVLAYMDVDLSTDLNAVLPLVAPLLSGHSDLAIGTRLTPGARIQRGPRRELISRGYNILLRGTLRAGFSDAQCGFKAIRADVAQELLPLVEDGAWFFDTELLILAERAGLRIHEVPVDWVDDPDSRVDILRTARDDVRGILRLARALMRGRVPLAEVTARLGRTADAGAIGSQIALFAVLGLGLAMTSGTLWLLEALVGTPGRAAEVAALTVAGLLVTVMRFVAMRVWVFRR